MARGVRDRLREPEARILALRIAAGSPGHQASTAYIKEHVPKYISFTDLDLRPSTTRANEAMWQQIVGNVVSHQKSARSIFRKGYATRTEDGIHVTRQGIEFLKSRGY